MPRSSLSSSRWQTLWIKHDILPHWAEAEPQNLFPHSAPSSRYWLIKEVPEMKLSHRFWAKHKSSCGLDLPRTGFLLLHPWRVTYLIPQLYKDWIFCSWTSIPLCTGIWYLLWNLLDSSHESRAGPFVNSTDHCGKSRLKHSTPVIYMLKTHAPTDYHWYIKKSDDCWVTLVLHVQAWYWRKVH